MSDKKKDLTRIEDLGEFLHELSDEDSASDSFSESGLTPETSFDNDDLFSEKSDDFASTDFNNDNPSFSSEAFEEPTPPKETESPFGAEDEFTTSPDLPDDDLPGTNDRISLEETSFVNLADLKLEEKSEPADIESFSAFDSKHQPEVNHSYTPPENFSDLKKFAENTSYTGMGAEGNPSFSVLIKQVRFIEDVKDIVLLLKELKVVSEPENELEQRLNRGSLLIPRISEFAAVFLVHKLRRFDVDLLMGLSDDIHPPKHHEPPEAGLVSKFNLYQNQTHNFHFEEPGLEISQILIATTPTLDGHQVLRYMGIASEHKMLEGYVIEDESSNEIPQHYTELAYKLKAHALKARANAIVGLNFQLTPIPGDLGFSGNRYRLTCTGNMVWVTKI